MIPNTGNLAETAPIKLLVAMDDQNQTGILYFRKNEILKVFYLNQGKISWAISSDAEDKIEHVLLAQNLVNRDALAPYLAGNQISESFGKILVENGLISLETLINASREQLKRIATSVMFWSSGNYQLEPESPPTRLVSLELEIVPLVYNYIVAHMDVNIIWEELGSLSGELQQISKPEKVFQYSLDSEQQEVFAYFREAQRPENVLLRFPAERKHAILKILYFLLVSGLLVKKEADQPPALDFNELDSLFGTNQPEARSEINVDIPAMINEADIKDIPRLDLRDIPEPKATTTVSLPSFDEEISLTDDKPREKAMGKPRASQAPKAPARFQPLVVEKPKSNWRSASFISILLTIIVVALFLWFGRTPKTPEPEPIIQPRAARTRIKPQQPQMTDAADQKVDPNANAFAPQPAAVESQKKTQPKKPEKKETTPAPSLPVASANARQAFASGQFNAAGDIWRQEMIAGKISFSILLEMDCLEQSVNGAYEQITNKDEFFILNRIKDGRGCWLVLWGKFRTRNEAQQNLELVSPYFFKQSAPPVIIELKPYL